MSYGDDDDDGYNGWSTWRLLCRVSFTFTVDNQSYYKNIF